MVDQVRFPPSIGGSGKIYTNDANPETGMFNGGHRINFFPILSDTVAAAGYVAQYAQAIDGAKGNADRAEDARGYVEAVADAYKVNIKDAYRDKTTLDLNFARGRYLADDGDLVETTNATDLLTVERATPKWVEGPNGKLREVPPNTIARQWRNGVPQGVLTEESRTNRSTYSNNISHVSWDVVSLLDFENVGESRIWDGGTTAYKAVPTTEAGTHIVGRFDNNMDGDFTFSAIIEPAGYSVIEMRSYDSGPPANPFNVTFDIATLEVTYASSGTINYGIERLANGCVRVFAAGHFTASGSNSYNLRILDNNGDSSFAGDGESGVIIHHMQIEEGTNPSSPIPTTDSPVTRATDVVSRELGDELNPSSGTVAFTLTRRDLTSNATIFKFGDDDNIEGFNGIGVQSIAAGSLGHIRIRHPDLPSLVSDSFSMSAGIPWRFALSYGGGVLTCFRNGTQVATIDYTGADQNVLGSLFKRAYIGSGNPMGGAFNRTDTEFSDIQYIPYALSEAELIELTS